MIFKHHLYNKLDAQVGLINQLEHKHTSLEKCKRPNTRAHKQFRIEILAEDSIQNEVPLENNNLKRNPFKEHQLKEDRHTLFKYDTLRRSYLNISLSRIYRG